MIKRNCVDCGKTKPIDEIKQVWRKYDGGHKETTVFVCKNGCFK